MRVRTQKPEPEWDLPGALPVAREARRSGNRNRCGKGQGRCRQHGRKPGADRRVERTAEGLAGRVEPLDPFAVHRVVLEARGGYERAVLEVWCAADLPVALVQPWFPGVRIAHL